MKKELWARMRSLVRSGQIKELEGILPERERADPKVMFMLKLARLLHYTLTHEPMRAIRLGLRLGHQAPDTEAWGLVHLYLSIAYHQLGDIGRAEAMSERAMETPEFEENAKVQLAWFKVSEEKHSEALDLLTPAGRFSPTTLPTVLLYTGILHICAGRLDLARCVLLEELPKAATDDFRKTHWRGVLEATGLLKRIAGDLPGAARDFTNSAVLYVEAESSYAVLPLAKALELAVLAGTPRPDESLTRRALALGRRGGPETRAGLMEHEALSLWVDGDRVGAAGLMATAGDLYAGAAQSLEAFLVHAHSAWMSWETRDSSFFRSLEYLRPRLGIYRFITADPLIGDFVDGIVAPVVSYREKERPAIQIFMLDGLDAQGLVTEPSKWRSRQALRLLLYLLLNRGRPLDREYLAWLLWPRLGLDRALARLRPCVSMVRRELGPQRHLLVCSKKSYIMLEDPGLWTDTGDFTDRIRNSSITSGHADRFERLSRALGLYRGYLLPGERDDHYIESHRQALHRMFRRALERAIQAGLDAGMESEALSLAEGFHESFPGDDDVARVYVGVLRRTGYEARARTTYEDFRKALWKTSRKKPSF